MRQQAYGCHQRVASPVWHPNMPLREVQYVGNPHLNTYDLGCQYHPHLSWEKNENIPQPPQAKEPKIEDGMTKLASSMVELGKSQAEFANSQAQFMNETRETVQIQSEQLKSLEVQVGQITRILLKDQQKTLPTFEEPRRVEVDAMELHELIASEEGPTSLEMEEKRK